MRGTGRRKAEQGSGPGDLEALVRKVATRRAREVVEPQKERLDALEKEMAVARVDLDRIATDLRSLEQRLDAMTAATDPVTGDEAEVAEARNVLEAVRSEHARVRARLQVVSRYEERIRRIEEAVVKLYGGDLRGPGRP
jgi:hypothetical protein